MGGSAPTRAILGESVVSGNKWHGDGIVAAAGKDGEARILGEAGIGFREFAEEKDGAAVGLDFAGVLAVGAEADAGGARFSRWTHRFSIR